MAGASGAPGKRIWVLARLYPPNFTGAGHQAHQIYMRLVRRGYSVQVLTMAIDKARPLAGQTVQRDGVDVHYLPAPPFTARNWPAHASALEKSGRYIADLVALLLFFLQAAWRIMRAGRRGEALCVYSSKPFAFIVFRLAKWKGMQRVLHLALLDADDPIHIRRSRNPIAWMLRLPDFRQADDIVCYSSGQIARCREFGIESARLRVIPGAVDLARFSQTAQRRGLVRREIGISPEAPVLVFVGSAILRKGIDILLEIYERVWQERPDTHLLIVGPHEGSSNEFNATRRIWTSLSDRTFSGQVHRVGEVADVPGYMAAGDIFCFPSRREGFGIVIVEAMAAGLPAVVSRLKGITTDIIDSGVDGILVEGFDAGDYAAQVLRLLGDPGEAARMGAAARKKVERCFDLERIVALHEELYA